MNFRSRKLKIFLLLLLFGVVGAGFLKYDRHQEVKDFFKDPIDLLWAQPYLNREINFCDAPWQETLNRNINGQDRFFSPSGRYEVKPFEKTKLEQAFDLWDNDVNRVITSFSFGERINTSSVDDTDVKWFKNEKFFIFRKPIYMDDDFDTSEIDIGDTFTGKIIYLGDSAFYDCATRNW